MDTQFLNKLKSKLNIYNNSVRGLSFKINFIYLIANLLIVLLTVILSHQITKIILIDDPLNKLIYTADNVKNWDYDRIPVHEYIGKKGYIEIVDSKLKTIYSGTGNYSHQYTPGIICFTSDVDNNTSYYIEQPSDKSSDPFFIISEYKYEEGKNREYDFDSASLSGIAIIDKNYKITYSNLNNCNIKSLTENDINALFENNDHSFTVKHRIKLPDKSTGFLIIHLDSGINPDIIFLKKFVTVSIISCISISFILNIALTKIISKNLSSSLQHIVTALKKISEGEFTEKDSIMRFYEFSEVANSLDETGIKIMERNKDFEQQISERNYHTAGYIHDMKNSLMSIMSYSEELQNSKACNNSENSDYITIVLNEARNAADLAHSLSEYNQINSSDFHLKKEICNLAAVFRTFLAKSYNEFKSAGFSIQIDIPEEFAIAVADEHQLLRVFNNFKHNFIKYCDSGSHVYFHLRTENKKAIIELGNTGPAIEPSIRERVFMPYVKGDNSNESGTGLGLALAQKIITLHSGTIELIDSDNTDFNNLFRISIPLTDKEESEKITELPYSKV